MTKRDFAQVKRTAAHHALHKRSSCATGGFYTNPTSGATVSSSNPVNITWDTSCLPGTTAVDIYLIAPSLTASRIHEWQNVNFALGSYQTNIEPSWWNDSSSISLQLSIVTSGTPPFLSPLPAGPMWTATYNAPSDGSTPPGANTKTPNVVTYVGNFFKNTSGGKIAAGILVPLLFIAIGVYFYIRRSRAKGKEKRKRFSEALDKRMSTISTDWKSITAAGANAAIRNSIAVSAGNRSSAFTFGAIRPASSALAVEGDLASMEKQSIDISHMSQLRPGLRASAFGERVSRVSFAADVRPSMESRRMTGTSRTFRSSRASSLVPPLPMVPFPTKTDTGDISPTQTQGAFSLTPEDIKARLSHGNNADSLSNMDEILPSLSMMRTGEGVEESGDDYLLQPQPSVELPMPPFPVHPAPDPSPTSPPPGMMAMPDIAMSPDDMLRAYATRKIVSPPTSPIAFPARTLSYNGSSMRTLYSPSATAQDTPPSIAARLSVAPTTTTDAEKRYTNSYAAVDPYAGFVG